MSSICAYVKYMCICQVYVHMLSICAYVKYMCICYVRIWLYATYMCIWVSNTLPICKYINIIQIRAQKGNLSNIL